MDKTGGSALFLDKFDVTTEELATLSLGGAKTIIAKTNVGVGDTIEQAVSALKKNGLAAFVVAGYTNEFGLKLRGSGIEMATLNRRDIDDIFHTFKDKDCEAYIIDTDEGVHKVKIISGSLSKSYEF